MTDVAPEHGDRVTYYDGDGEPHNALVVSPVSDAEYVTVVTAPGPADIDAGYNSQVHVETSVHPHADLGDQYTATGYAFKPGWNADAEEA